MANPDSERKPDDKKRETRISTTAYDGVRVFLSFGTVLFAGVAVATAIWNQYFPIIDPLLSAVAAVLCGYIVYYLGRKKRSPVGQDFNF